MKIITVVKEVVTTEEKTLKMPQVFKSTRDLKSCVDCFGVSECTDICCDDCMLEKKNRPFLIAALQKLTTEEE